MKLVDFLSQPDQLRAYAKIQGEISVPDSMTGHGTELYSSFGQLLATEEDGDIAVSRVAESGCG